MNAWFKKDRTVMNNDEFQSVYTEYVDSTGMYDSEEFEKVSYIEYLNGRISSVNTFLHLQRLYIEEFKQPYYPSLNYFTEKFGYKLSWNKDCTDFLNQLEKVEFKEKKYISKVEGEIKELIELRKTKNKDKKETSEKQSRENFVRTINSLRKLNYQVDVDKNTVEELALMIKFELEENNKRKTDGRN